MEINFQPDMEKDRIQCQATTLKGHRCSRPPMDGGIFCLQHNTMYQNQSTEELKARQVDRRKSLWKSLREDKLVLLLIGFVLTTILGGSFTWMIQQNAWERQKQHELLRNRLETGFELVDELGSLVGNRFFNLQRVFWALESEPPGDYEQLWKEYYRTVIDWNTVQIANQVKLRRLFGEKVAWDFMSYADLDGQDSPRSIHGRFKLAHDRILDLKRCVSTSCQAKPFLLIAAREALIGIDVHADSYIESLGTMLIQEAENMELGDKARVPQNASEVLPNMEAGKTGVEWFRNDLATARAFFKQGRWNVAADHFYQLSKDVPLDDHDPRLAMAESYYLHGAYREAAREYNSLFAKLFPD